MVNSIEWSKIATRHIKDIFHYYHSEASYAIAKKVTNKITERVSILYNNPKAGQIEELLMNDPDEYRYLVVGNYKVIYFFDEIHESITISAVFDTRQYPLKMRSFY